MDSSARTRGNRSTGSPSVLALIKLIIRLTPQQFSDEFSLALQQMKQKGIKAGIAVGFVVVALLFALFLAVALIVAAIMGLATVMDAWLAALAVAALFLLITVIAALIGVSRFKKALPLYPEDAIHDVRYDIGVLREGRSFDPASLDVKKPKEDKKQSDKGTDSKPKQPVPSYEELRSRSGKRREQLADLRDKLGRSLDFKAHWKRLSGGSKNKNKKNASGASGQTTTTTAATAITRRPAQHNTTILDRWKPLSVLVVSAAAIVVMARRLVIR